jgi:release factor glutamine methyltransferase
MTPAVTIAAALTEASRRLGAGGIDNPRGEARLLLCHVLGFGAERVLGHPEHEIGNDALKNFWEAVSRRVRREPMSHVLGKREFWSLDFQVTPDTLDPRPDSETLVEAVLLHVTERGRRLRVLDLGTGTGCLLLAILSEFPNATGVGIDISAPALEIAKANSVALGLDDRVEFHHAEWDAGLHGAFDIVVSNPPYIPTGELAFLEPEVALFEPRLALDGGVDGLREYRALVPVFERRLKAKGVAVIELGAGQSGSVGRLMAGEGFDVVDQCQDLGGVTRCLVLRRAPALTVL